MHKNLPEIAARWEKEYGSNNLPARIRPKKDKNMFKPRKPRIKTLRRIK